MVNPFAPITHHWLDATHIAFGVFTAGLYGHRWKAEGSLFNGREPDEYRYGIDLNRLDSFSGRLWVLPSSHWALQASVGRLNEVERELTGGRISLTRSTASAAYQRTVGGKSAVAAFVAWGANTGEGKTTHALIAEANLTFVDRDAVFARAEVSGKTVHDLAVEDPATPAAALTTYTLGKLAIGYSRSFGAILGITPGFGVSGSLSLIPASLRPFYGTTAAPGVAVIMSLRPPRMDMPAHAGHDMMNMP